MSRCQILDKTASQGALMLAAASFAVFAVRPFAAVTVRDCEGSRASESRLARRDRAARRRAT
jgi:hypothetical protein